MIALEYHIDNRYYAKRFEDVEQLCQELTDLIELHDQAIRITWIRVM